MDKRFINRIPFIIVLILSLFYVFAFYGKVLFNPNDYMFTNSGDGIKNYFTYAYHIKHDTTYTNFEGMNYPYGENFLYTDCHPVIANLFKSLSSVSPYFETHSVGLLNIFMILAIILTFIFIYIVLVELELNKWLSIVFSICITLLAPQIFRLSGHLALSYSFAIPLSWYLILKCIKTPKLYFYILLFLNNLFWMFIHAYLGIIIISFLFSFVLIYFVSTTTLRNKIYQILWLGLSIFIPVLFFYLYVALTDIHVGRTDNPSGFFLYNAEIDDLLIPSDKPFRPFLNSIFGNGLKLQWEAKGYIGILNVLFLVFIVVFSIISIFYKKSRKTLKSLFADKLLNSSLIAAFVVFLFAMAIPFKQIPVLLEIFSILKQFRATGRFIWPFYFVFSVYAAYVFQKRILIVYNTKSRFLAIILVLFCLAISCWEGYYYHKSVSVQISKSPNLFDKKQLSDEYEKAIDVINPDDYQSIVTIPFYYYGSESFARPRQDEAVRNSFIFSYHTGIPNMCVNLTRTSVEESKRIVQVVSPNFYEKNILTDLKSRKPFLILKTGNEFTKYEELILKKGKTLYKSAFFELLQINFDDLFSDDRQTVLNEYLSKKPYLIKQDSFYVSGLSRILYYNGFENTQSDTTLRGKGSFVSKKKGKNVFAEFSPNTFQNEKEYDVSIWMFNGEKDALNLWFRLIIEEYDENTNQWYTTIIFPESAEVINNNWSLVEGTFTVHNSKNKIYIVSKGKEDSKATLHVDDLLIKEKGIDVFKYDEINKSLFYNNHKIDVP